METIGVKVWVVDVGVVLHAEGDCGVLVDGLVFEEEADVVFEAGEELEGGETGYFDGEAGEVFGGEECPWEGRGVVG